MHSSGVMGHTRTSVVATEWIKNQVRREIHSFNNIIIPPSKELLSKKLYMQNDEFLKDKHNVKMFELSDELLAAKVNSVEYNNVKDRIISFCKEIKNNIIK